MFDSMSDRTQNLSESLKTLELPPGAEWDAIKKSYYALAKQFHPDRRPGDAEAETRIKEINRAYQILKSELEPPALEASRRNQSQAWRGLLFGDFGQALMRAKKRVGKYANTCDEFLFPRDVMKTLQVDAKNVTDKGKVKIRSGRETLEVDVPFEDWSSLVVKVPQKGEAGLLNGVRGDLLLNIQIVPQPKITGEGAGEGGAGQNLRYKIQTPRKFVENGKVLTLQTHEGPIKFFLPKAAKDGQTFVLRAKRKTAETAPINHIVQVHLV